MSTLDTLSTSDRAVLRTTLSRMIGNALGALTTLPLMCFGDLPETDARREITERHEVWRSYLVVIGEMMKSQSEASDEARTIHRSLLRALEELRNAYMELAGGIAQPAEVTGSSYFRLANAYDQLEVLTRHFANAMSIDEPILPPPGSLKRVSFERSLSWLRQELETRSNAPATGS